MVVSIRGPRETPERRRCSAGQVRGVMWNPLADFVGPLLDRAGAPRDAIPTWRRACDLTQQLTLLSAKDNVPQAVNLASSLTRFGDLQL